MLMSGHEKDDTAQNRKILDVLDFWCSNRSDGQAPERDVYGTGSQSGIDIVVLLDVSISMQSIDFKPNRLEVAKDTIDSFITKRSQDRIALVVFKATAHTLIPLTHDHNILRDTLRDTGDDSVVED